MLNKMAEIVGKIGAIMFVLLAISLVLGGFKLSFYILKWVITGSFII